MTRRFLPRTAMAAGAAVVIASAMLAGGASPAAASVPLPTLPSLPGTALPLPATTNGPGAKVPFTEYEAENARTNGTVLSPSRAFTQLAAEASGRRAVSLKAGQYVDFTLAKAANAVDVRYAIPDGPDSTLHVSARQPDRQRDADLGVLATSTATTRSRTPPTDGGEHHYFDDARTMFAHTLPAGTRVRFQADAGHA